MFLANLIIRAPSLNYCNQIHLSQTGTTNKAISLKERADIHADADIKLVGMPTTVAEFVLLNSHHAQL